MCVTTLNNKSTEHANDQNKTFDYDGEHCKHSGRAVAGPVAGSRCGCTKRVAPHPQWHTERVVPCHREGCTPLYLRLRLQPDYLRLQAAGATAPKGPSSARSASPCGQKLGDHAATRMSKCGCSKESKQARWRVQ